MCFECVFCFGLCLSLGNNVLFCCFRLFCVEINGEFVIFGASKLKVKHIDLKGLCLFFFNSLECQVHVLKHTPIDPERIKCVKIASSSSSSLIQIKFDRKEEKNKNKSLILTLIFFFFAFLPLFIYTYLQVQRWRCRCVEISSLICRFLTQ